MSAGKRFSAKFLPVLFWSTSANWGNSCMLGFPFSICCPFTGRLSGFEQMCTAESGRLVRVSNPLLLMEEQKQKQMRRGTCLLAESEGSLAWKERLMRSIQEGWEGDELVEREAEVGSRFKNADLATAARFPVPRLWLVRPAVFPNHWLVRGGGGKGEIAIFLSLFCPLSDSRFDHFWGLTNATVETLMAARLCKWQ